MEFLSSWNEIKAIAISKPGKDVNNIQNYRVISLQNVIYKVFNKHLKIIFNKFIATNKLIPNNSFGFRSGVGVNEFSVDVVKTLENNIKNKYITVAVSIDLEKAFDRVNTNKLVNMMRVMGFEDK